MFTASMRKINAAKAASLDYLSLLYTLLADGLVFHKLPNGLSLAGAGVITAASLGSLLWAARAPSGVGREPGSPAAAGAALPQEYKREFYLGSGSSHGPGKHKRAAGAAGALCHGGGSSSSSSEGEAVSLIKAVAAGAGWAEAERSAASRTASTAGLAGGQDAGHVVVPAGASGADAGAAHAAAKLALASCLTDSSKSWRLGTELDAAAADAAAEGCLKGMGNPDGCTCGFSAAAGSGNCSGLPELQAVVAAVAAGTRTSTEKEQALAAAGK